MFLSLKFNQRGKKKKKNPTRLVETNPTRFPTKLSDNDDKVLLRIFTSTQNSDGLIGALDFDLKTSKKDFHIKAETALTRVEFSTDELSLVIDDDDDPEEYKNH